MAAEVHSQRINSSEVKHHVFFESQDPKVIGILDTVSQIANTDATVLITGESGTGKEIIAQLLHQKSSRCNKGFVAVNCGAIVETLQESEIFGHVKGAFTGAATRKIGKFEAANHGTIFLDEVGEMSKDLQVKFLRILQSGEYAPVGSAENCYADVRVIAATNKDLHSMILKGGFREDFYYRLNILRLELPPLRERKCDIVLLARHFIPVFSAAYQKSDLELSEETKKLLVAYDFPGNIRELENIIHRAVILCSDKIITPQYLPPEVLKDHHPKKSDIAKFHPAKAQAVERFERDYLISMLHENGGIISRAAQQSGLSERNFHEKLKKYGIHGKSFRSTNSILN